MKIVHPGSVKIIDKVINSCKLISTSLSNTILSVLKLVSLIYKFLKITQAVFNRHTLYSCLYHILYNQLYGHYENRPDDI